MRIVDDSFWDDESKLNLTVEQAPEFPNAHVTSPKL